MNINEKLALERTRLANRRTLLAYIRTGLSFIALGIALFQLLTQVIWNILGIAAICTGTALVIGGFFSYKSFDRNIKETSEEGPG